MNDFKILLVGDFSGVHITLRDALREKRINVTLISDGDSYKGLPADILFCGNLDKKVSNILSKISKKIFFLLGVNGFSNFYREKNKIDRLVDFDVVQLINPLPFQQIGWLLNMYIIYKLKRQNKKIFLCALGEDYYWVKACLNKKFTYCALDNLSGNEKKYKYSLKFLNPQYKFLNDYCINIAERIIPGLLDYKIAYDFSAKCNDLIPLPVCNNKVSRDPLKIKDTDKIIIFHGWQIGKELKKGNYIFDNAIKRLQEKYKDQIEYIVVKNVPYEEYVKSFSKSHIFIDQCFSYDKGVNALLGMASGKVVFSGFEYDVLKYYGKEKIEVMPLINAIPDENLIYLQLEDLILNKGKINKISAAALGFITNYHLAENVSEQYLAVWKKSFNE
ncbi:glycosyltransferase family 1 protein [Citrobacter portucalensis]|uniref:glycosyltransferase family 1 protein n=1 Tax=Citrobacter portucalensis TaxID=1639133 RepID=UPI001C6FD82D|nr:glycosyltransferase family 1 protein [Citrobacter portucalensis]MBW9452861.1 glycosyltransferase family 1 protein [Citrobacter portucalensis]MBW9456826.1 glycosyltransferase family 1 protein [Citrobacter portucalensis]